MMSLFERGGLPQAEDDKPGTVRVIVRLVGKGSKPIKGNICRSLTANNAKVSEVFEAITGCLFEETEEK